MLRTDIDFPALAGNERWFLVHALPKCEAKAELRLKAQGFCCYMPLFEKTVRHARKLRTVRAPLFPRYLFVILDLARDSWSPIRSTIGVSRLFTDQAGRPVAVPVGVVESLIERSDGPGDAFGYQPGQRTAGAHPVGAVHGFRRDTGAAGRGRTGTGAIGDDGDRGSCHTFSFGACAGGVKTARRWRAAWQKFQAGEVHFTRRAAACLEREAGGLAGSVSDPINSVIRHHIHVIIQIAYRS